MERAMAELIRGADVGKLFYATFDKNVTLKVLTMLNGLRKIFGVEWLPTVKGRDDQKLAMITLVYPKDLMPMIAKEPKGKIGDRLWARGCKFKVEEQRVLVAWPIAEVIKLADEWADLDAAGITSFTMDEEFGFVAGTIGLL
jgi:hypothetical protein